MASSSSSSTVQEKPSGGRRKPATKGPDRPAFRFRGLPGRPINLNGPALPAPSRTSAAASSSSSSSSLKHKRARVNTSKHSKPSQSNPSSSPSTTTTTTSTSSLSSSSKAGVPNVKPPSRTSSPRMHSILANLSESTRTRSSSMGSINSTNNDSSVKDVWSAPLPSSVASTSSPSSSPNPTSSTSTNKTSATVTSVVVAASTSSSSSPSTTPQQESSASSTSSKVTVSPSVRASLASSLSASIQPSTLELSADDNNTSTSKKKNSYQPLDSGPSTSFPAFPATSSLTTTNTAASSTSSNAPPQLSLPQSSHLPPAPSSTAATPDIFASKLYTAGAPSPKYAGEGFGNSNPPPSLASSSKTPLSRSLSNLKALFSGSQQSQQAQQSHQSSSSSPADPRSSQTSPTTADGAITPTMLASPKGVPPLGSPPASSPAYNPNSIQSPKSSDRITPLDNFGSLNEAILSTPLDPTAVSNADSGPTAPDEEDGAGSYIKPPLSPLGDLAGSTGRLLRFERLLSEPNVPLDKLRKLAWSGIPPEARARTWRILLGYAPPNKARREQTLTRKRAEYASFINKYYKPPPKSVGPDAAGLERASRPASVEGVPTPELEEAEMYHQIAIDLPRTLPEVPVFQHPRIASALERMLVIWAVKHPASGYVQGMNDLATPFLAVFLAEAVRAEGRVPGGPPEDAEILSSEDMDVLSDSAAASVEADAYWCFTRLMDSIQSNYTAHNAGIQLAVFKMKEVTRRVAEPLHAHFEEEGLQFIQFSFRWMNCLLMREWALPITVRVWDTYFAEEDFASFHVYVCVALLCSFSPKLLEMDLEKMILFLQSLPTKNWGADQVALLLSEAFMYKELFERSPQHLNAR